MRTSTSTVSTIERTCFIYSSTLGHWGTAALPRSSNTSSIELGSLTSKNLNPNLHFLTNVFGFWISHSGVPKLSESFLRFLIYRSAWWHLGVWLDCPLSDWRSNQWTLCDPRTVDQNPQVHFANSCWSKSPKSIYQNPQNVYPFVDQINVFCNPFDQNPQKLRIKSHNLSVKSLRITLGFMPVSCRVHTFGYRKSGCGS